MLSIYLMIGMVIAGLIYKALFDEPDAKDDPTVKLILSSKVYVVIVFAFWTVIWPCIIVKGIINCVKGTD